MEEYLKNRNMDYQERFIQYLNKNKERVNNHQQPYECERCEQSLTRPQVQQVVRNISCNNCAKNWAKELYQQEKKNGTLNEKPKQQSGGARSRERRNQRRNQDKKGKQPMKDSSGDDES